MASKMNERKTNKIVNFCSNIWPNEIKSVISQRFSEPKKLNHIK